MRGGHNRKPTSLHVLAGTYRKDRHGKAEPKPRPVAPPCPAWLDSVARREWRRVAPELEGLGLLTVLDQTALTIYCVGYSDWRKIRERIDREGAVTEGVRGTRKHPLYPAMYAALASMMWACREFGMTPSARGRMSLPEVVEEDEFDKFLDS